MTGVGHYLQRLTGEKARCGPTSPRPCILVVLNVQRDWWQWAPEERAEGWEVRVGDFPLKASWTFCILCHVKLLTIQKYKYLRESNKKRCYWKQTAGEMVPKNNLDFFVQHLVKPKGTLARDSVLAPHYAQDECVSGQAF